MEEILITLAIRYENSGKTREIVELIELKNKLYPSIKVIVITCNSKSPHIRKADLFISTGSPSEGCPPGLTPTTSTTVLTVIGDALVVLMMEKTGFSAGEYAKRHQGGYLGVRSGKEPRKSKTK